MKLKSRYRKHINRVIKASPTIGFSKEGIFIKNESISEEDLNKFNKCSRLDEEHIDVSYRNFEKEMYSNFLLFVDNYLVCGGHEYIYLLTPTKEGEFKIVERESISEWVKKYWEKEDPYNKREWRYLDEDTADLYEYITDKFDKNLKFKIKKYDFK